MHSLRALSLAVTLFAVSVCLTACETEDPTYAVVENTYTDGVVYKAWWVTTLFTEPVPSGASSVELRSVPDTGFAYALLAPGWDPESGAPPTSLVVVKSRQPLTVKRGGRLLIRVSDERFEGQCSAKAPLTQEDADFITQRVFVSDFANIRYDAATCRSTLIAPEADGGDGGDGG